MAYISNKQEKNIGDTVILKRKVDSLSGYFEKESEVKITSIDPIHGYGITDEFGNSVIECGWDCF